MERSTALAGGRLRVHSSAMLLFVMACSAAAPSFTERAPCPASPNCVSSVATGDHAIAAFAAAPDAIAILAELIATQARTTVVTQRPDYLHVTFTSALFRFVDDVEFWVVDDVLHVRSASRVGHGDMGVNRARVETLRGLWQARIAGPRP